MLTILARHLSISDVLHVFKAYHVCLKSLDDPRES